MGSKNKACCSDSVPAAPAAARSVWEFPVVAVLLALHWSLAISASMQKSATFDEPGHLTSGYTFWVTGDYRMNDPAGVVSCKLMALPLLAENYKFPPIPQNAWMQCDVWTLGHQFLYEMGNDGNAILLRSRATIALFSVVLGLLVYLCSRKFFGLAGGMLSLILYAFCPAFLCNGALATIDLMASLFFFVAMWCFWIMLQKLTPWTLLGSSLAVTGLLLAKMSGVLIAPMLVLLLVIRVACGKPLPVKFGKAKELVGRWKISGALLATVVVHLAVFFVLTWAAYDFRYTAVKDPTPQTNPYPLLWQAREQSTTSLTGAIFFLRDHRILPEAYLHGFCYMAGAVNNGFTSYFNGECSLFGWRTFFPYAFAVKTPLSLLAVVLLALVASIRKWRESQRQGTPLLASLRKAAYNTAFLWVLLAVYWVFSITSKFNIGHRHILPAYVPMLVLAGSAAYWFTKDFRRIRFAVAALVLLVAAEALWAWPNYLAYFNQLVPADSAYKHLVDSSLDWGQDLPALKQRLKEKNIDAASAKPAYLAYFGMGSPTWYKISAIRLPGYWDSDLNVPGDPRSTRPAGVQPLVPRPILVPLRAGTYCISASILCVYTPAPGPWIEMFEKRYQELKNAMSVMLNSPQQQEAFIRAQGVEAWNNLLRELDSLRFSRLCAYLRHRTPDENINSSILLFHLTDKELEQALAGPPAELLTADKSPFFKANP